MGQSLVPAALEEAWDTNMSNNNKQTYSQLVVPQEDHKCSAGLF